jgi:hypothetical protein
MRVVQFECWLRDRGEHEFVPALHEALRRRGLELADAAKEPAA